MSAVTSTAAVTVSRPRARGYRTTKPARGREHADAKGIPGLVAGARAG
jgi:hypothetical protein